MTYKSLRSEWCWLAWEVTDPRRSPKIDAYMRPFGTACTCLHASCSRVLTGATEQRTQRVWGGEQARQSASALPSHPATCMTSTPDSDKHLTQGTGDKAWGRKGIWVTRGFSFSPCHAEFPQPFPMNTESSSSRRRKIRSSSNYSSRAVRRECSLGKKDAYPQKITLSSWHLSETKQLWLIRGGERHLEQTVALQGSVQPLGGGVTLGKSCMEASVSTSIKWDYHPPYRCCEVI